LTRLLPTPPRFPITGHPLVTHPRDNGGDLDTSSLLCQSFAIEQKKMSFRPILGAAVDYPKLFVPFLESNISRDILFQELLF